MKSEPGTMTADRIKEVNGRNLQEMTDGYLLIAVTDSGELIVDGVIKDARTAEAMNSILMKIMAAGGAGAICEP